MKSLLRSAIFLALTSIISHSYAQTASVAVDKDAKAWVGLNVGGFWQSSDINARFGVGGGLTFDYFFIRNKTSIFGLGFRGQYLQGNSRGLGVTKDFDIQDNPSLNGTSGNPDYASLPPPQNYVYQNFSTNVSDLSGNLIITLNRLRAVSRINLYVFGGLGATGYKARMDQLDASNNLYDYNSINSSLKAIVKNDLKDLLDGNYETYSEKGKKTAWTFTPTVGAGFGVQVSPRVQLGIEYKVGFTGTDLLDANRWSTSNSRNDIYHYATLGTIIGLGQVSGSRSQTTTTSRPARAPRTRVNPPVVTITSPSTSVVTSENCVASITAVVTNIVSRQDISVTQNGLSIPFAFSRNRVIISNVNFNGTAEFIIRATNSSGTTQQSASFICQPPVEMITICHRLPGGALQSLNIPVTDWAVHAAHGDTRGPCPVIPPPSVRITSPTASPVTLENCIASVTARVENISGRQDITVTHNGVSVPFVFDRNTVTVSNINFTGTADFVIQATNPSGTAQQVASFICKPRMEVITICHRVAGGAQQSINIPAAEWAIHAAHGDTQGPCPVIPPPMITITSPTASPVTVENCVASVTARVENISGKQNVTVAQNGFLVPFGFNQGIVTIANVNFSGTADFVIKATNGSGTTEQTVSYICRPRVEVITICHKVAGAAPQTINVPLTEWAIHAAHGDTRGTCPVIPPPTVTITSPTASPVTLENCIASVTARVENISNKQDITVTQNGLSIPFAFAQNTVTVSNVSFTGTASFTIKATNTSGMAEQSTSFICKPRMEVITICHKVAGSAPQTINIPLTEWATHAAHGDTQGACPVIPPPTVTITSPASSPVNSENCVASVVATIGNVSSKQDIMVTQNGSPVAFNFSGNTVIISNVNFTGTTDFVIKATNASGIAEKSATLICKPREISICHYPPGNRDNPQTITIAESAWSAHQAHGDTQGPCPVIPAPVVVIISPTNSPITSENCIASVTATVENVSNKQGITVTQNGSPIAFDFNGNTVTVSTLSFTGTANFIVKATNVSGSAERSVSFICKPKEKEISICHYPPGNRNNPQTITIAESAWPAHQAHGDTQGACPVIPAPVVAIVSPTNSPITSENCIASITATVENVSNKQGIAVTQNGSPIAFDFTGNTVTVSTLSFTGTANFVVKATNASGTAERSVSFICKPKEKEISICHYPPGNRDNPQTITIAESAWPAHQAHGDTQGACPAIPDPVVTITSPTNSPLTSEDCVASITATVENVSEKQSITVTQNGSPVAFNFSGKTVTVSNVRFEGTANFKIKAKNASGTAEQSASFVCQPKEISICHYPPGNRDNPQAITIAESAWPAHQAHGDTQGACPVIPDPVVTITSPTNAPVTSEDCIASITATVENISEKGSITVTRNGAAVPFDFSGNTVTVSKVSFDGTANFKVKAKNASGTAEQSVSFICKPKEISICHYPPGNRDNPQDITIAESAWPAHEAHGDTQGACPVIPEPELTITSPEGSAATVEDCKASIQASVKNITAKESISVTLGGKAVRFTFANGAIKISGVPFTGTAKFVIKASNKSGSVTKTVEFKCEPKEEGKPDGGDEKQPKEEEKIEICHHPPGNRGNVQTITIPASAWPAHEKHGDTKGPCKEGK
jgi:large repetitive protein